MSVDTNPESEIGSGGIDTISFNPHALLHRFPSAFKNIGKADGADINISNEHGFVSIKGEGDESRVEVMRVLLYLDNVFAVQAVPTLRGGDDKIDTDVFRIFCYAKAKDGKIKFGDSDTPITRPDLNDIDVKHQIVDILTKTPDRDKH